MTQITPVVPALWAPIKQWTKTDSPFDRQSSMNWKRGDKKMQRFLMSSWICLLQQLTSKVKYLIEENNFYICMYMCIVQFLYLANNRDKLRIYCREGEWCCGLNTLIYMSHLLQIMISITPVQCSVETIFIVEVEHTYLTVRTMLTTSHKSSLHTVSNENPDLKHSILGLFLYTRLCCVLCKHC